MIDFTQRMAEMFYPLSFEAPDSFTPATVTGAYGSLGNYHRAWLVVQVGEIVATGTVDASIVQAQDAIGTGVKAITGKAITQLTQAGGDGDQILSIELRTEELDIANGFEHVAYRHTVGVANAELGMVLFAAVPRYAPVPTTNWTEIVD